MGPQTSGRGLVWGTQGGLRKPSPLLEAWGAETQASPARCEDGASRAVIPPPVSGWPCRIQRSKESGGYGLEWATELTSSMFSLLVPKSEGDGTDWSQMEVSILFWDSSHF